MVAVDGSVVGCPQVFLPRKRFLLGQAPPDDFEPGAWELLAVAIFPVTRVAAVADMLDVVVGSMEEIDTVSWHFP